MLILVKFVGSNLSPAGNRSRCKNFQQPYFDPTLGEQKSDRAVESLPANYWNRTSDLRISAYKCDALLNTY